MTRQISNPNDEVISKTSSVELIQLIICSNNPSPISSHCVPDTVCLFALLPLIFTNTLLRYKLF